MIYPEDFESKIGFDTIRRILIQLTTTRIGYEEVDRMSFSTDFEAVLHSLGSVREMMDIPF